MTRIVAGTAGGRRLTVPPRGTRPTSERVREALFNALEAMLDLDGRWVLDLYAGSGALGFEALSRGAAGVTFVESDRRAVEVLRRNAGALGLPGARVVAGTVEACVAGGADRRYDVVLADPPYAVGNAELLDVLTSLVTNNWLAEDAVLVVERATRDGEPPWPPGIAPLRARRYGDTATHWAQRDLGAVLD
ncbi:MAG TPA: 16S rRNA (guanine(966)-N(2))-methyltransferase RsmD [Pseudonocardiaceae bacterium]|nr:16S rRNA (guanine(966)-N(2))-methyltransferase RsmD [Pseudonocardiaceae bacterium]